MNQVLYGCVSQFKLAGKQSNEQVDLRLSAVVFQEEQGF